MFKKNKNKEDKSKSVTKTGDGKTTVLQTSSERLSGNVTEQRSFSYSSTTYSSVRVTKSELGRISQLPSIGKSTLGTQLNIQKPDGLFAIDAKPFKTPAIDAKPFKTPANGTGYQSPFSRKLSPYTFDARPTTSYLQPSLPTIRNTPIHSSSTTPNLPRYSSYVPQSAPLNLSPSTHSLPTSSESATATRDPRIPTYNTNGKKRGKVLVINNIKFLKEQQERKGAEKDERNVETLFKRMGFDVEIHRNLKKADMLTKVKKFSENSSLKNVDISVVIMMSHGSNVDKRGEEIDGGFTQIYGTDDIGLPINEVLGKFSTDKCPAMGGKPKIFIFQCCRGKSEEKALHYDARPIKRDVIKSHADMLIAFSTLPGFFSARDPKLGTWYIQSICEVFEKFARDMDVEALLKIVDEQLSQKHPTYHQTSSYESRGFKRCYLNPKP